MYFSILEKKEEVLKLLNEMDSLKKELSDLTIEAYKKLPYRIKEFVLYEDENGLKETIKDIDEKIYTFNDFIKEFPKEHESYLKYIVNDFERGLSIAQFKEENHERC